MKTVLITGAGSGIGFATAKLFAQKGFKVIAVGKRKEGLDQLRREIGEEHEFIQFDLRNLKKIPALVKKIEQKISIDVLINNTGVGKFKKCEELSDEEINEIITVNLLAPMALSREILRFMKPRGGIIVNIASVAGKRTWKHLTAYSASKFGLMGFSNSLRREMKFYQYPIKIIVVCPPAIDTPFFANAGYKDYKKDHPGQTLLPPEIVAEEIYSAVMKGKREVVIGRRAKILDMLYRMSPRFTEWLEDFLKKK